MTSEEARRLLGKGREKKTRATRATSLTRWMKADTSAEEARQSG